MMSSVWHAGPIERVYMSANQNTVTPIESATDMLLRERPVWGPFIGGQFEEVEGSRSFEVLEAATGRPMARVVDATDEIVHRAVSDSRRAYEDGWRYLSPKERGVLMREVAQRIRDHAEELAELVAREVGKPRRDALKVDVVSSHSSFDYYAGIADTVHGEILDQGPIEARIAYEPYGVVAAILPFNWPPIHFSKKCAPAIAVGNTVVIKPGEQAPLTVLRLVEIANEVLPPGVINAVSGISAGAALASHPRVERISFTGSTVTGRKVMVSAAKNLTFATLELGGKNALIVLEDANLDDAIAIAIEGMFYNQGEACTSTSRILVHSSIYDEFARRFVERTRSLVIGDPLDPKTDIGPMVDARQQERVQGYAKLGVDEGAKLLYQGSVSLAAEFSEGFYVAPCVLGDVTADMSVAREEIFGPVACLMRFETDDEAVVVANSTEYGLTAAICTGDEVRASRLAQRLEVGMVFVNNYTRRTFIGSPFGGVKGSGYGREYGAETLHEFVRAKNVRFPSGRGSIPGWPPPS
ncbi:MAG: betaine-aldehyde dehydrogenase [Microbacteriaceae bacterium]|jgi:acyl-CoA reductase-like NAD-dependent aldehyde dehydrogenase|nr:betaine-aldehyde dehydrogenase [Microbacteriaceae bacterium]